MGRSLKLTIARHVETLAPPFAGVCVVRPMYPEEFSFYCLELGPETAWTQYFVTDHWSLVPRGQLEQCLTKNGTASAVYVHSLEELGIFTCKTGRIYS